MVDEKSSCSVNWGLVVRRRCSRFVETIGLVIVVSVDIAVWLPFFYSNHRKKKEFSLFIMRERNKHASNSIESCNRSKHLSLSPSDLVTRRWVMATRLSTPIGSRLWQMWAIEVNESKTLVMTSVHRCNILSDLRLISTTSLIGIRTCRDLPWLAFERRLRLRTSRKPRTDAFQCSSRMALKEIISDEQILRLRTHGV